MSFLPPNKVLWAALLLTTALVPWREVRAQSAASQHVQLEGQLQILAQDFKDRVHINYSLKLHDGTIVPMRFLKESPLHLSTGDHVRAEGDLSSGTLVLYSGATNLTGTSSTGSASPVSNTLGQQSTLVILVNFQDAATQPYTVADAQNMFFGTVNNFVVENSYGQTSIAGSVVGWYTIPESITACDMTQIATDAQNAAVAGGANLSNYTRYVYVFPYNSVCGWAGSSYVGGSPSQSWINGSMDVHTISHELGHAFGLWHSHFLDCGSALTIGSNCAVTEYGDLLDVMGLPQTAAPHYNAFQKERLGWVSSGASPTLQLVQTSGTYTINPYELGGAGPNALKILKSTDPVSGAKTWYYIEARQAVGFDSFLSNGLYAPENETTGVLFHIGTDNDANSSNLLDMTPATATNSFWYDPSLAVGQSFQDSAAGVTFTPVSVSGSGATVQVSFQSVTVQPAISVATNQPSYSSGQSVAITVTVVSGTAPTTGASVTVTVIPPSGKSLVLKSTTGSNGTAQVTYKLPRRATVGTYQVQAVATGTGASSTLGATTSFKVQ